MSTRSAIQIAGLLRSYVDLELGATVLERTDQLRQDANWRVHADPAGHPFCLCLH